MAWVADPFPVVWQVACLPSRDAELVYWALAVLHELAHKQVAHNEVGHGFLLSYSG